MRYLAVLLALYCSMVGAAKDLPYTANELLYLPVLQEQIDRYWPDTPQRSTLAAQSRQETCPSLKSKQCWNPHAELKTDREYGFGLGQITLTKSFDNFKAAQQLDSSLRGWRWEDRYRADFQLRTMVLMDRFNYGKFSWAGDRRERLSFAFAAYNGGIGGVLSDRRVCAATAGCDQNRWFGNVELTSKKAKVAAKGYGQSFYQINRGYVTHIMIDYSPRYKPFFKEE